MVRIPYIKIPSVRVGSIVPTSNIGTGGATPAPPTPITYLTQWKMLGNSEVHGQEIWSCGEYNPTDGKYHILVQPQEGSIADIALTEPLRKYNDMVDTIEFPSDTEGKALVTRNVDSKTVSAYTNKDGSQLTTTLPDNTILHIRQIIQNGDFSNGTTSWIAANLNNVSISVNDNKMSVLTILTAPASANYRWSAINSTSNNVISGNSYYTKHYVKTNRSTQIAIDGVDSRWSYDKSVVANTDSVISFLFTTNRQDDWRYAEIKDEHIEGDEVIIDNVVAFDLDVMFADCPSLKPTTTSDFEALFTNISYIDYSSDAQEVIVNNGKLYKDDETGIEILVPLAIPTTELVDAPQIEEADSYTCVISQGGKAVEWSSFTTNSE